MGTDSLLCPAAEAPPSRSPAPNHAGALAQGWPAAGALLGNLANAKAGLANPGLAAAATRLKPAVSDEAKTATQRNIDYCATGLHIVYSDYVGMRMVRREEV